MTEREASAEAAALRHFHEREAAAGGQIPAGEQAGGFRPGTAQGDPEKMAYLRNANYQGKTRVQGFNVDRQMCPGCMFPDAPPGKWPHTHDRRCKLGAAQ